MSRIEAVGLVLGAIPLAAKAFKVYAESVSTVGRYRKYKHILRDLYQEIDSERIEYLNTCELLLDGIVDDNAQKTRLLQNPGGDEWQGSELEGRLKRRLAGSYETYMKIIENMNNTVEEINALLKLGPDGKVSLERLNQMPFAEALLSLVKVQLDKTSRFKDELQRIKFSINKANYEELIAKTTRNNVRLSKLTEQNRALETSRQSIDRKLPDFEIIQKTAIKVYNALSTHLQCDPATCAATHSINLRLECRERVTASEGCLKSSESFMFRVILSYCSSFNPPETAPWKLEALDIRPFVDSPCKSQGHPQSTLRRKRVAFVSPNANAASNSCSIPEDSSLSRTHNLCKEIPSFCSTNENRCVRFLEDKITRQKIVLTPERPFVNEPEDPAMLSLRKLIGDDRTSGAVLSWSTKLQVAVIMASSLLQLHGTPWLAEEWNTEDVGILSGMEGEVCKHLFISKLCKTNVQM